MSSIMELRPQNHIEIDEMNKRVNTKYLYSQELINNILCSIISIIKGERIFKYLPEEQKTLQLVNCQTMTDNKRDNGNCSRNSRAESGYIEAKPGLEINNHELAARKASLTKQKVTKTGSNVFITKQQIRSLKTLASYSCSRVTSLTPSRTSEKWLTSALLLLLLTCAGE